jgi:hypothetical protein
MDLGLFIVPPRCLIAIELGQWHARPAVRKHATGGSGGSSTRGTNRLIHADAAIVRTITK